MRTLGVQQRSGGTDFHRLANAERMNRKVDARLLIDLQNDVLFFGGAKASRLSLTVAGRSPVKKYSPCSSVFAVCVMLVPTFVMVTAALTTMAPL